jgi:hypothetical protein
MTPGDDTEPDSAAADAATIGIADGSRAPDGSDASALPDGPLSVLQLDAGQATCQDDTSALGSITLVAGGATPAAFASAFNAQLLKLPTPGPFLLTLSGVGNGPAREARFGALKVLPEGVDFAEAPAEVPFSMDANRTVRVAHADASFGLQFVSPATATSIPVAAVELTASLTSSCTALSVTSLKLMIPSSAASTPFDTSTLGALLGTPSASLDGGASDAWVLELSGRMKQVQKVLVQDPGDGGNL